MLGCCNGARCRYLASNMTSTEQPEGTLPPPGLAVRVWGAWHALPRSKNGKPPSWRKLEREHDLPDGVIGTVVSGRRRTVEANTAVRLARAFNVSLDWLLFGTGAAPTIPADCPPIPTRQARAPRTRPLVWPPLTGEPAAAPVMMRPSPAAGVGEPIRPPALDVEAMLRRMAPGYTPPPPPLETLGDRAWFAWQCLPRDEQGLSPAPRALEQAHELPEGLLSAVFEGRRKSVTALAAVRLARALCCDVGWLLEGVGTAPELTGRFQRQDKEAPEKRRLRAQFERMGFGARESDHAIEVLYNGMICDPPGRDDY